MLKEAHFVYGPIRAEVEYAGRGAAPPAERRTESVHLWRITLKGPKGAAYTAMEWSPAGEKPDLMLLGAMVRSVIVGLQLAVAGSARWRERMSMFDEEQVEAAIKAAGRFAPWLRRAAEAALADAARIESGGRPTETRPGPKEWWPGV